ncbi:polyamine ABC transporter ATP-binding protein [Neisseria gonorrhoeae]|nr:polyamine ABC transporter ATP-binding protein [Neisseria gonorrhoeae]
MNLNQLKNKLFRRPGHLTVIAVTYTPPTWDETVYISW